MPFDKSQKTFQKLLKIIKRAEHQVVPFIGAGLSIYGEKEERLPLWSQLIHQLIQRAEEYGLIEEKSKAEIENLVNNDDCITAIDKMLHLMGEYQFRIFVEDTFNIDEKPIPPAIVELVCISWSLIVTTNLDKFIENAWLNKNEKQLDVITNREKTKMAQAISSADTDLSPKLIKLHGTVEYYESWVLTGNQYEFLVNDKAYAEALKNLFLRTIFFLGYGLNDGDFQVLLSQIKAIYPAGVGNYFALFDRNLKGSPRVQHLMREYGVQPIWYNVYPERHHEPDCGHGEVLECLQVLVKEWLKINHTLPIYLKYFPELEPDFEGRASELMLIGDSILSDSPESIQVIGFGGEGKTTIVQQFLKTNWEKLVISDYKAVFGCSFYRADAGRFINDAYSALTQNPQSLDIPSKVSELINIFTTDEILLVLDGIEVIQDSSGQIQNPYLKDLFLAAIKGACTVIITSRIPLELDIKRIDLGPLAERDVISILKKWGVSATDRQLQRMIKKQIGSHALSVRIIAGFIKTHKNNAIELLKRLSLDKIPDEADPLKANKAARILDYYYKFLPGASIAFMQCFSIFRRPVATSVILDCFSRDLGEETLNKLLVKTDLRPIIRDLIDRRLLILESGQLLSAHPTVRDYFRNRVEPEKTKPLHKTIALYYAGKYSDNTPNEFNEALKYFEICYHSAHSEQWSLFHKIFYKVLNREHENYLGNTIGAWEEFLDLALLAYPDRELTKPPVIESSYYSSAVARSYKHLGQSSKSRKEYIRCLDLCSETKATETARYVNNFMSLSIYMGRLDTARHLVPLNIATLKWIKKDWKYRWQLEFACFLIGRLAGLLNDLQTAEKYCRYADRVWEGYGDKRLWFFDYYREYYSDIILATDSNRQDEALKIIRASLNVAEKKGWKETISSAHRSICSIYRDLFRNSGNLKSLDEAKIHLDKASEISDQLYIPRLEVEILLERIAVMVSIYFHDRNNHQPLDDLKRILSRLKHLIDRCHLRLYEPEFLAAQGWLAVFERRHSDAKRICRASIEIAERLCYSLIQFNKNKLLNPLCIEVNEPIFGNLNGQDPAFPQVEELLTLDISPDELKEKINQIVN